jgi:hypothetical protein
MNSGGRVVHEAHDLMKPGSKVLADVLDCVPRAHLDLDGNFATANAEVEVDAGAKRAVFDSGLDALFSKPSGDPLSPPLVRDAAAAMPGRCCDSELRQEGTSIVREFEELESLASPAWVHHDFLDQAFSQDLVLCSLPAPG